MLIPRVKVSYDSTHPAYIKVEDVETGQAIPVKSITFRYTVGEIPTLTLDMFRFKLDALVENGVIRPIDPAGLIEQAGAKPSETIHRKTDQT